MQAPLVWGLFCQAVSFAAIEAKDYEKAAEIFRAESGKGTGKAIVRAATRARMSADAAGEVPEPTGFAAKVILAGKRRRGEV
jgi:hypothetical protein